MKQGIIRLRETFRNFHHSIAERGVRNAESRFKISRIRAIEDAFDQGVFCGEAGEVFYFALVGAGGGLGLGGVVAEVVGFLGGAEEG